MKNLLAAILLIYFFASCEKNNDNDDGGNDLFTNQTVSMGQNSTKDVYFSLANGEARTVERSDWDLAFSVPLQTASILINEGAGIELYCVGDTNAWNSVDENSINGPAPLFNDESDWLKGAFNIYSKGFPNYGWGTYHAGNPDHNVGGDSLFVIKLSDGSLKKFMVRSKLGTNIYQFRWADLNGENEITESLPAVDFVDKKHFIHYSLVDRTTVDVEPDMNDWDLLFTRYIIRILVGPSQFMDYPVMGVLSNQNIRVAKITGKAPEDIVYSDATDFSSRADAIGHDWKESDPVTHEISLVDNTGYVIESVDGNNYVLYFSNYGGNTAGTIEIKTRTVE